MRFVNGSLAIAQDDQANVKWHRKAIHDYDTFN